ncbi:hypothetical protein [Cohnella mopanensis]|uniref:hypothetical protein n=1 Tax=Cohnella mopanensis TaxID=2911966 RepID=UPI001EF7E69D|nr:hypothetical protein [Cohnella mopanensis]
MNKEDELLKLYGLEPDISYRETLQKLLNDEIDNDDYKDNEYLKTLCIMLFSIGQVEDTQLVWRAKRKSSDAGIYIDVQLLCGAGLESTIEFLDNLNNDIAKEQIEYLKKCEETDFKDFSKTEVINNYKQYYGI